MEKVKSLKKIKALYQDNVNIIQYLRGLTGSECNSTEEIMISYDFQAGTYTKGYKEYPSLKNEFCARLAEEINKFGDCNSILEVGVGEATTIALLMSFLPKKSFKGFGFDISWSRIKYGKKFLAEMNVGNVELFLGDLFSAPIKNNSIDIVYTCHSIESNGGREKEALIELYRITNKYLLLLEPSFEFANHEGRERMLSHNYVTKLYSTVIELGYNVIEHRLFGISSNPLNPTGLIIIKKNSESVNQVPLCCPITKANISLVNGAYFSEESLLAYPIIAGIPCLLPENAIVATKFLD